jgi:hypothetical protein
MSASFANGSSSSTTPIDEAAREIVEKFMPDLADRLPE